MRRAFAAALLLATPACFDDDVYSPDDPAQFSSKMFNGIELARYEPHQRAYVMGHATAVYLYGKKLPEAIGDTGFPYAPGVSGPAARVEYDWEKVMVATSGGTSGMGVMYDDVEPPPPEDPQDPTDGDDCTGSDDVGNCDDPVDPVDPDDPGEGTDPWVDEDCETFLDPAGFRARELTDLVPVDKILVGDFKGPQYEEYVAEFRRGLRDALRMEDLGENTEHSEIEHLKDHVQAYGLCDHSPIVLDLDGDGIQVSDPEAGVRFDMFDTRGTVRTAWPSAGDALLAMDRDGDGKITSSWELFGEARLWFMRIENGFERLRELDANADGVVDARDPMFGHLRAWRDADRDGESDAGELLPLADAGVTALPLAHDVSDARDAAGNAHRLVGSFRRADGTTGQMIDVWFRIRR